MPVRLHRKGQPTRIVNSAHKEKSAKSQHNDKSVSPSSTEATHETASPSSPSSPVRKSPKKEQFPVALIQLLDRKGWRLIKATSDGNCLYNCMSRALFNNSEEYHMKVRQATVDWIESNLDTSVVNGVKIRDLIFLKSYHTRGIDDYLEEMRQDGEFGDYCCLNALSNLLQVAIDVYYVSHKSNQDTVYSKVKIRPINGLTTSKKIRLEYFEELKHYNLLVPLKHSML